MMRVPDEGHSRDVSLALISISTLKVTLSTPR